MNTVSPELQIDAVDDATRAQIRRLVGSPDFDSWAHAAARVTHCARPIRLRGESVTLSKDTGEALSTYSSESEPTGTLHVRCGNRRADVCPSCSRTYAADTFHMIRCGVTGGKGVPETVAEHPLVFLTLTAPSFGPVHREGPDGCRRRVRRPCAHGVSAGCGQTHAADDPLVGQPLCADCYDYLGHLTWQWWAPELWRRFTIQLRRTLASRLGVASSRLASRAVVQFAKVAEFQRRGVVHFHALIRLDGPSDAAPGPPGHLDAPDLAEAAINAATSVRFSTQTPTGETRTLRFGSQADARLVTSGGSAVLQAAHLSGEQVAGYLAKYATKSAGASLGNESNGHLRRLRALIHHLADRCRTEPSSPYALLSKWVWMLGFRGHFSTKSRRYSVTLTQLRQARRQWQAQHHSDAETAAAPHEDIVGPASPADDTILVVGSWSFAGSGWRDHAQAELARAAALKTAEYARERSERRRRKHPNRPAWIGMMDREDRG